MKLTQKGYIDFDMLGYFRSTESNCFNKLSDPAVLTSHILRRGQSDKRDKQNVINEKLYCLITVYTDMKRRMCTKEETLKDKVWSDLKNDYDELKQIINVDGTYYCLNSILGTVIFSVTGGLLTSTWRTFWTKNGFLKKKVSIFVTTNC